MYCGVPTVVPVFVAVPLVQTLAMGERARAALSERRRMHEALVFED